jgi:6-phosphogluconolactonase (cycloisomerase 2 family)
VAEVLVTLTSRLFLVLAIAAAALLSGCNANTCMGPSITTTGTSGGGDVTSGGTVCGAGVSTGGGGSAEAYAFYLDGSVETAALSTTGTLQTATNITAPAEAGSTSDDMVVVNGTFLYVPYGDINAVQAFSIDDSSGALTAVTGSPFALQATAGADAVVTDPKGRYLFVGDETHGAGSISVFQINSSTGALTEAPGSPFFTFGVSEVDSMAVDGSGKYLYAAQGTPLLPVLAFSIDQNTGALSPVAGSPFALSVAQIHADSTGNFLLGVQEVQDGFGAARDQNIYVFGIDPSTGAPITPGTAFATVGAPFDFTFSPNNKFVYSQENDLSGNLSAMEGFQFDSTAGTLTPLSTSPFSSLPDGITQCKFDQGGGLMFCASNGNGALSVFTADPSAGGLTSTVPALTVVPYPFAVTD